MTIVELTEFQMKSLRDAASVTPPTYMLVKPNAELDTEEQYINRVKSNTETDQLVELGLIENITAKFSEAIMNCAAKTGRIFRVFILTKAGFIMFADQSKLTRVN